MTVCARAEEGMWTYDNIPTKLIQQQYGFTPTQAWLDHVRLSSVRLNDGGSGSFVSADGLLLTNHHVARGQLAKNSTVEHDYIQHGFYAKTQAEEMKSPDLEINVLTLMENVTARVQAVGKGLSDADALKKRDAEIAAIEKECEAKTGLLGQVVTLYQGGEYWLYGYKKYTDVRIVFAPEAQAAFYGGDPDNFTYPRYDLDMALFRVYENGKPIHTDNYLKWDPKGPAAHDLVFISGNPGSTQRDDTVGQLKVEATVTEPAVIELLQQRLDVLQKFSAQGAAQAREAATLIFSYQNSLKVYIGRKQALADPEITAKKQAEETDFRQKVNAKPELKKLYGSAWDEIDVADKKLVASMKASLYRQPGSSLATLAAQIVDYVVEVKKPDGDRLPGYHDAQLPSLQFRLASPAPVYKDLEIARMTGYLQASLEKLGPNDPWVKLVLDGKTPAEAAASVIDTTQVGDPKFRKQLIDGGPSTVDASTDPMIVLARKLDPLFRATRKQQDAEVEAPLTAAGEKLGKARFAVYGKERYPDATFTPRLSYGQVDGYPLNGSIAPPMTTMYGLYDRSASFANAAPFNLPERWASGVSKLNLATPMDFVSTNDIIGGNSGSPVINRNGDIVGLVFDGNIESLSGDFVYDGKLNRAVSVDTAAMSEALRKLYGADALADEIEGTRR